ncbi:MAG: hypothetical protein ABI665_13895 [Vicinamibacterales bacterium]
MPTINCMILSDRVVRHLEYDRALSYATHLATRLTELFASLSPTAVIGAFDGFHGAIAFAVARKMRIPWFAMHFSTIPMGLSSFCSGLTPNTVVTLDPPPDERLRLLAEETLDAFERKALEAPAYYSANDIRTIIERLPRHVRALTAALFHVLTGRADRQRDDPVPRLMREYLRKRINLFTLPRTWFVKEPPRTPYLFFGLHMQPESSIDVWAPFHSDQTNLIEQISRSTPATHQLLVKLHKSDADNYSRRQLSRLRRLPGVKLVSPFVSSRPFIEKAALTLSIQGTIGLEAALLGRPVLMFGESEVMHLPSASQVGAIAHLPEQISAKLKEPRPDRESMVRGLMAYLRSYSCGCSNYWDTLPSNEEIHALANHFKKLGLYVAKGDPGTDAEGLAT